jgi:FkbM family methyltransferase
MAVNKNIFVLYAAFICILLIVAARHHPPSRRKIKEIWHGRVYRESESNTTMLRSSTTKVPDVSVVPDEPDVPDVSNEPVEPVVSVVPDEPVVSDVSVVPDEPVVSDVPVVPDNIKHIVIVIPYRDREKHYIHFVENLNKIQRQDWKFHLIIVEQGDNKHFRRGWLLNIGIEWAEKHIKSAVCIITHDIDMIADKNVDYTKCDVPSQPCSELSCENGGHYYHSYSGGTCSATLQDWKKINGYTNKAHGWGGEDDELYHRFRQQKMLTKGALYRPSKGYGVCKCMHGEHHTKREKHPIEYNNIVKQIGRLQAGSKEWQTDGLNSLKYNLVKKWSDGYGTQWLRVNDEQKKYIGVHIPPAVGLGNNLFMIASVVGIALQNKATPCYTGATKFSNLINVVIDRCPSDAFEKRNEQGYAKYAPFGMRKSTMIGTYLQSYKYFKSMPPFKIREELNAFAQKYVKTHSNKATNVGIHVRRGDHLKQGYLNSPDEQYFKNAMQYFTRKYGDVQFFVASNDISWCKKQPFFKGTHIISEKHTAAQDMAILANCDHVIISLGTFGWWSGLLSGGEVVYYENEFNMEHNINKGKVATEDYYPSKWKKMNAKSQAIIQKPKQGKFTNTIVTAFFELSKTKHTTLEYKTWMQNMLSLKDAMVVFTDKKFAPTIKQFRATALEKTKIIIMELSDTLMVTKYSMDFWKEQHKKDPEQSIHGESLYIIWNEKANWLQRASKLNPFDSDFFAWVDIGYFRNTNYNNQEMLQQVPSNLGKNQVMFLDVSSLVAGGSKRIIGDGKYLGGGFIGGYAEGIDKWYQSYYDYIDSKKAEFIGKDQPRMYQTCSSNKGLCNIVQPKSGFGDPWFYMAPYLKGPGSTIIEAESSKPSKCLQDLAKNMPLDNKGVMKAHHWDARTGKWNEDKRWLAMNLQAPCIIWYVGANTHGRDGVRLQKDYNCDIHVFEPVPSFANALVKNWENVPRSTVHAFGLGSETKHVNGVKVVGESTFAMSSSSDASGETVHIKNILEAWEELGKPSIDLLHMNCDGCEWEMLETLLSSGMVHQVQILQVGTHWFAEVKSIEQRYCAIEAKLETTHEKIYQQYFGWERWQLKQNTKTIPVTIPKSKNSSVSFIVQLHTLETLDLVRIQLENIRRFLPKEIDFEYHAVISKELNTLGSLKFPKTLAGTTKHECPVSKLTDCMNHAFRHIIPTLTTNMVIHLNIDMFLIKKWNPFRYLALLGYPDIIAVIEDHANIPPYLHPGLVVLNMSPSLIKKLETISFDYYPAGDVGSMTSIFMQKHPDIRVKPMVWSRHFEMDKLVGRGVVSSETNAFIKLFLQETGETMSPVTGRGPDVYTRDFAWLHFRDISCWSGCSPQKKQFIQHDMVEFISKLHPSEPSGVQPLKEADFDCWGCATTTTGRMPRLDVNGMFNPSSNRAKDTSIVLRVLDFSKNTMKSDTWMESLYKKADEIATLVASRRTTSLLQLPKEKPPPRTNLALLPPRYSTPEYKRDTSYYWRYIYDGTQDLSAPEVPCNKKPGQKYWAVTYADGAVRNKIARLHTRPSCLMHGVDEVLIMGPEDLDEEYRQRNRDILQQKHGVGLWIWKHYVQYQAMGKMKDGDIMLYIDSDFRCDPSILQYFCLTQSHDVVGFHHSNSGYTLSKLASRDSMILMGLDTPAVASSVQSSGGNILFRKSPLSVEFVREMAAWSQQMDVVGNRGAPSKYGVDWPAYIGGGYNHQCDQSISSLLMIKYGIKTFPWHMEGYGAGSDDILNAAQRNECGLNNRAMTIHVKDNLEVSWIGTPHANDVSQIKCVSQIKDLDDVGLVKRCSSLKKSKK